MESDRTLLHTRQIEFKCYRLSNGLWEIEGTLQDVRHYDTVVSEHGLLPAGAPVHQMVVTATLDDELTIKAVRNHMSATPFQLCRELENGLDAMIGARIGPGWRRVVNERIGGTANCTHLRELLVSMATAAIQSIPIWGKQQEKQSDATLESARPFNLDQCYSFRANGPVIQEHFPRFFVPTPSGKATDQN